MPTIIDSLFLELGIDTSKFSADQQKALAKIQQFESQTKRAATGARKGVQTVGDAFRDLANDSAIGAGAKRIESLATKVKSLGQAAQVSGGLGTPFGAMAEGLGMLLSPAALGIAAIGALGVGIWDLDKKMTAANATTYRNAQLSGMAAKQMWAWGEAAKTVGGDPAQMQAGITGLQTAIAGQMIGVGNATAQLTGLARLSAYGARWSPQKGVDIQSLFAATYKMAQQQGRARTWALVSGYGLENETEFNLAMKGPAGYAEYQKAQKSAPKDLNAILAESVKTQASIGERQIAADAVAEKAYGLTQATFEKANAWLGNIYNLLNTVLGPLATVVSDIGKALGILHTGGKKERAAVVAGAKAVGRFASKVTPVVAADAHKAVRATVGAADYLGELFTGLFSASPAAQSNMAKVPDLIGKTRDKGVGNTLLGALSPYGLTQAQLKKLSDISSAAISNAYRIQNDNRSSVHIDGVHVHTNATDPAAHADAVRKGLATQPLLSPLGQQTIGLASRGAVL